MELQVVELFIPHAAPYLGDAGFGGKGELGLHHPVVIRRLVAEHFLHLLAFVLAEIEDLAFLLVKADEAGQIGPRVDG